MNETARIATIFLALVALHKGAIEGVDFDFIEESPERAEEVAEFTGWLSKFE